MAMRLLAAHKEPERDKALELKMAEEALQAALAELRLRERQYLDAPVGDERIHDARLLRLQAAELMYTAARLEYMAAIDAVKAME
ncbi:hypothetical protein [Alicyclobacillus sendaiensis]|uniref:hypothetical protein n=1 Tax=Alicyclobacillus sendaiensis TaxID=192387 RepID=UPI0026F437E9|nr:hypothetical protein [Alicyclobacillus sendaiensis]